MTMQMEEKNLSGLSDPSVLHPPEGGISGRRQRHRAKLVFNPGFCLSSPELEEERSAVGVSYVNRRPSLTLRLVGGHLEMEGCRILLDWNM